MLEAVSAIRFDRRMSSGKTWPCLLVCQRDSGEEIEIVAKFSAGFERGVGGVVTEAIAAMLAADLGLPVPEPFLVEFDAEFASLIRPLDSGVAERAARSASVAFGSRKLPPGFTLYPSGKSIQRDMLIQAAEIFAFDTLIQNADRRPSNPNCLYNGRNFACFDHELAFITEGIIGWQPPWVVGGLESYKHSNRHLFFLELQGKVLDLSRLKGAWLTITDARLHSYREALPKEWADDKGVAEKAIKFIAQLRDNIDSAIAEVERVLR